MGSDNGSVFANADVVEIRVGRIVLIVLNDEHERPCLRHNNPRFIDYGRGRPGSQDIINKQGRLGAVKLLTGGRNHHQRLAAEGHRWRQRRNAGRTPGGWESCRTPSGGAGRRRRAGLRGGGEGGQETAIEASTQDTQSAVTCPKPDGEPFVSETAVVAVAVIPIVAVAVQFAAPERTEG